MTADPYAAENGSSAPSDAAHRPLVLVIVVPGLAQSA
ncbi:hypothetical protein SZN_12978 [Streptomyces zinciresistens K42]|uniref:Uncharacterized protein n=1 Tax=Streptomyces zinciresistens K42 TaxID=700597 RepID=G2GAS8_9ACTN|nr:hypothetical protein SZN_12978 [Streptomyces zinciresistens K42]